MKLVVGLGNPGKDYERTRHNVGFMVVEASARRMAKSQWQMEKKFQSETVKSNNELLLVKPQTFMNSSGVAVAKIMKNYKLTASSIYVVHDDLDIKLGEYKIQFGKGPHKHNGVTSVEQQLKTKEFWHVRVGVAGKHYEQIKARGGSMAEEYVLKPFANEEKPVIEATIEAVVTELLKV
jgi:PTH1 family peptidyl-tRNA hydrolase